MSSPLKSGGPDEALSEIGRQINRTIEAHLALVAEGGIGVIRRMADVLIEALRAGRRIYIMGNGGSAAESQHMAAELVGRFLKERRALPAQAFSTDTSILTAVGNDYGFDSVFERQVEAHVQPGDVVFGLSTSGNSPNVCRALERAKTLGARTLALSGRDGGKMKEIAELCLVAPANESPRIQEVHLTVIHILCAVVEEAMSKA